MESPPIIKNHGRYLPHWTKEGGIYAVCFRLVDSIPRETREQILLERQDIEESARQRKRSLSAPERLELLRLQRESVQRFLRNGYGACWLKDGFVANTVANALRFFEDKRYKLFAWCIMPNHVHIVVKPFPGMKLTSIVRSWKVFSAKEANAYLNRSGSFWCEDNYDHLIRNTDELRHAIEYTWSNPEYAGFREWKWRWKSEKEVLRFSETQSSGHRARLDPTITDATSA
ncbi:MAG: transposase [Candidatus Peregrinibacteria bacterium]